MSPAGQIDINMMDIVMTVVREYGVTGFAVLALFYYVKSTQTKIDKLIEINNRVFGVMLSLADRRERDRAKDEATQSRSD